MVAIRTTAGALTATWCAYSVLQRHRLARGRFADIKLLSETRRIGGDPTNQLPRRFFQRLPRVKGTPAKWDAIAATQVNSVAPMPPERRPVFRAASLCCEILSDTPVLQYKLWAQTSNKTKSVKDIAFELHSGSGPPRFMEDIGARLAYHSVIDNCKDTAKGLGDGVYTFCFRDYVNYEELHGMLCQRWCVENFLYRPSEYCKLIVDSSFGNIRCVLEEHSCLLGFIPVEILWKGHFQDGQIDWTTSSMTMGWKKSLLGRLALHKIMDKPKVAEKLRSVPWQLMTAPKEAQDMLVLRRGDSGSLVFVK